MNELKNKKCLPCEGKVSPLAESEAKKFLDQTNGWEINSTFTEIYRRFDFKNFYHTMAFVNAVAWIANQENHHPDLEISYQHCKIRYSTHAIQGLSENDFICAAKINTLL